MVKITCTKTGGWVGDNEMFAENETKWVSQSFAQRRLIDDAASWTLVEPSSILQADDITELNTSLAATTDGASGADQVAATAISGWAGTTVQSILESAKAAVDAKYIIIPVTFIQPGALSATITLQGLMIAQSGGSIEHGGFSLRETGADASNPLSAELDIQIKHASDAAASVFSTKPAIAKNAVDGASTYTSGTGVTVGVINAAAKMFVSGDLILFSITVTRTASPQTEMAGLMVQAGVKRTVV